MNYFKSIFTLSIFVLFIGVFSASAQKLTKANTSKEVKNLVMNHLKAAKKGPTAAKAIISAKSGSILGFNIGMPPTKNILIIIFRSEQEIRNVDRIPSDALKISAELGAGLKAKGISPETSMVFQVNTKTMKVEKFSGVPGTGKSR